METQSGWRELSRRLLDPENLGGRYMAKRFPLRINE